MTLHLMYMFSSLRGPWNALSPIPENNAIAVDDQVFYLFLVTIICVAFSVHVFIPVSFMREIYYKIAKKRF